MTLVLKARLRGRKTAKMTKSEEWFCHKYGHLPVAKGYAGHLVYRDSCVKCGVTIEEIIRNVARDKNGKPKGWA